MSAAESEREDRYPPFPQLRDPTHDVESWSETLDDRQDESVDVVEMSGVESLRSVAEGYVQGRVVAHLHLRVRATWLEPNPCEFCAVIASDRGNVMHVKDLSYISDGDWIPGELARELAFRPIGDIDRNNLGIDASNVDESVLVHIIEPRKEGEIRVRRAFSTLKGLDRLDHCPIVRAYASKHGGRSFQIPLPAFIDRELRLPCGAPSSQQHELPKEIVKRGPQVVCELSDDDPDTGIGELASKAKDVLAGIALELTDDAAVFLVKDRPPFAVERGQVLLRAFKTPIDGF